MSSERSSNIISSEQVHKTLITPLGFDTSQIISFIVKDGIGKNDKLIILRPEERPDEKRGERAYDEVKKTVSNFSSETEIEKKILDTKNFEETILDISNILKDEKGEIVINLSGGVRTIIIALTACSVFFNHKITRLYNYEKIDRDLKQIELPYGSQELTDNEKMILQTVVQKGPKVYNELIEELDLSRSTVSRLSNILKEKHLVQTETIEKQTNVIPTLTGKLISFEI
ncbi:MAG: CRISPR-associated CARF protein Csa3 [Candidatus Saliniplasma sp.]